MLQKSAWLLYYLIGDMSPPTAYNRNEVARLVVLMQEPATSEPLLCGRNLPASLRGLKGGTNSMWNSEWRSLPLEIEIGHTSDLRWPYKDGRFTEVASTPQVFLTM